MKAYIALGSNVGNREYYFREALHLLQKNSSIKPLQFSSIYETEPVGGPAEQGEYLNAALELETSLSPRELLAELLSVEKTLGRERSIKNAPRTLDLDLLFYGDQVVHEEGIQIPHPRLHERDFVLKPLCDLIPDFIHPVFQVSLRQLKGQVSSTLVDGKRNVENFQSDLSSQQRSMRPVPEAL